MSSREGQPMLWTEGHIRGLHRNAGQEQPLRSDSKHALHQQLAWPPFHQLNGAHFVAAALSTFGLHRVQRLMNIDYRLGCCWLW